MEISRRLLLGAGIGAAATALVGVDEAEAITPARASLFDASFASAGLSRYANTNPRGLKRGVDWGITADPRNAGRKVVWFDSRRRLTQGTKYPRASVVTRPLVKSRAHGNSNDLYWMGFSFYLPSSQALRTTRDFVTIAGPAYGAPYGGASPLQLAIVRNAAGHHRLQMGANPSMLGTGVPVRFNTWINIAVGFRFGYAGWVELWTSNGAGNHAMRRVQVRGASRLSYATMRRGCNDGWHRTRSQQANYSSVGVYSTRPMRILFGHHKVGRRRAEVLG